MFHPQIAVKSLRRRNCPTLGFKAAFLGRRKLGPTGHTAISAGIGAGVWAATGSPVAFPAVMATGVFNDLDHLFDYYIWYRTGARKYCFYFFHAWEYTIVGLVLAAAVWRSPVPIALALGHLGHMLTDQSVNRPVSPFSYFLTYRIINGFRYERSFPDRGSSLSGNLDRNIPFWRIIGPVIARVMPGMGPTK